MKDAETKIGYSFKDKTLLRTALTHSSYANEYKCANNERLEFLGDSVLSIVVSDYLYRLLPSVDEGVLSKYRATLVCEQSLYDISKQISLSSFIFLGRGEEQTGGRERPSIVSDAFEAVLAAIYLDGGMEIAKNWVTNLMRDAIEDVAKGHRYADYKTMLQEALQKGNRGKVTYRITGETGLDHNKEFEAQVIVDGVPKNTGRGKSKKEAEQDAAHIMLRSLGKDV